MALREAFTLHTEPHGAVRVRLETGVDTPRACPARVPDTSCTAQAHASRQAPVGRQSPPLAKMQRESRLEPLHHA
jgi:hypothetical protein